MYTKLFTIAAALALQCTPAVAALKSGEGSAKPKPEASSPESAAVPEPATVPTSRNPGGPIFVFPFKSEVSPASLTFLRRALKEAERAGASAFVLDMDTPGGRLDVTIEIFELMHRTKVPTITFVNPHALSAGALVSLATKKIYMRPDATIGAAAVVSGDGQEIQKTMQSKIDSFMAAKMRAVCEENGHNPDIAEAFMVATKELKVGDALIDSKDTLLSLNGREAAKLYDGKPLLATGLAESIEEVLKAEGLIGAITNVEATGFERIAFWITMLAPLLLMGGIIGAYIEMKTPGFGIPGIVSLICFGLFFGGHLIAGLAGWESVILFVIGMLLVMFEIFAAPGTVLPGIIGAVLVLGSIVWAMVDRWPGQHGLPARDALERPLFNLVLAAGGAAVCAAILAKFLPKTSIYQRLVLSAASAAGPAVTVPIVNLELKAGDVGVAATTLRPAGKATFRGEVHDVVTAGDFVTLGTSVRVVSVDGMRVVVEPDAF
jgi:membrane-bound serine protease (ClpP class)